MKKKSKKSSSVVESWDEKYRPRKVKDIIDANGYVAKMAVEIEEGKLSHYLFSGPAGTGKTTTALVLGRYFLKIRLKHISKAIKATRKMKPYYYNASDDRKIDFVRNDIKTIINRSGISVIILDEFDEFTKPAQAALRTLMEKAKRSKSPTFFILTANEPEKIIEPLHSRVTEIIFPRLDFEQIFPRLEQICTLEGVNSFKFPSDVSMAEDKNKAFLTFMQSLYRVNNGDMRKTVNMIQKYVTKRGDKVRLDISKPPISYDVETFMLVLDEAVLKGIGFKKTWKTIEDLIYMKEEDKRMNKSDFLNETYSWLRKNSDELGEILSSQMAITITKYEHRLVQGTKTVAQLSGMFSEMHLAYMVHQARKQ